MLQSFARAMRDMAVALAWTCGVFAFAGVAILLALAAVERIAWSAVPEALVLVATGTPGLVWRVLTNQMSGQDVLLVGVLALPAIAVFCSVLELRLDESKQ